MKAIVALNGFKAESTEDRIKLELPVDYLMKLFKYHPTNEHTVNNEVYFNEIYPEKKSQFAYYVATRMLCDSTTSPACKLGETLDEIFLQALNDKEEFIKFVDYDDCYKIPDEEE
jgi:hypothetical protein